MLATNRRLIHNVPGIQGEGKTVGKTISNIGLWVLLLTSIGVHADAMKVVPGKWEMRSVTTNSMMPQPNTNTSIECVTDGRIDPSTFMQDNLPGCGISNVQTTDSSMAWEMSCNMQGNVMQGAAEFTSSGNAVSSCVNMTMSMGGQQMAMSNQWTGRHIRECD